MAIVAGLIVGVGAVGGALISANGAQSAASTSAQAADQAAQVQQNIFNTTQKNLQPWISGGGNALQQLQVALGLIQPGAATSSTAPSTTPVGPTPPIAGAVGGTGVVQQPNGPLGALVGTLSNGFGVVQNSDGSYGVVQPNGTVVATVPAGSDPSTIPQSLAATSNLPGLTYTPGILGAPGTTGAAPAGTAATGTAATTPGTAASPYAGFQSSPGYQFQLSQGLQAIQNQNAGTTGLNSGNTLKALQTYGTGLANQDWYNYLNQLTGLSNTGENAAANLGNTGVSAGANIGNSIMAAGNATAAGQVGSANAINSGIGSAVQNYFQNSYLNGGSALNNYNGNYISPSNLNSLSTQASNNLNGGAAI